MTQKSSYCIAAGVAVGASIMMGGAVYAAPVGVSNIENFYQKHYPGCGRISWLNCDWIFCYWWPHVYYELG